VSELIGTSGSVYVEVDDRQRARAVLETMPGVSGVHPQGDGLVADLRAGRRSDLVSALVAAGLRIETIMPTQRLEDAFLEILEAGDAGAARAVSAPSSGEVTP
jgi:ABC-2 type transport system ATP-binding protein